MGVVFAGLYMVFWLTKKPFCGFVYFCIINVWSLGLSGR